MGTREACAARSRRGRHPVHHRDRDNARMPEQGVSLLELLLVVAVIAILAAILLPVLMRAKEGSNKAKCLNNCKQLSAACRQYADDHNDRGPSMLLWGDDTFNSEVRDSPLWNYSKGQYLAVCPSEPDKHRRWTITYNGTLLNLPPVPHREGDYGTVDSTGSANHDAYRCGYANPLTRRNAAIMKMLFAAIASLSGST